MDVWETIAKATRSRRSPAGAGHAWITRGSQPVELSGRVMSDSAPLEQLSLMGFDHKSAMIMAQAEHEDWCRYYLVGGRERSGSARGRGGQPRGHAVASASTRLPVTPVVANLHSGRDGHRGPTQRTVDVAIGFGTHHARRCRRLGRPRGRQNVVGA